MKHGMTDAEIPEDATRASQSQPEVPVGTSSSSPSKHHDSAGDHDEARMSLEHSQPQSQSQSQSQTQTQTDFLTQNELTQLMEDDSNSMTLSPLVHSPPNLRILPWGRLIPCRLDSGGIDLLPRSPDRAQENRNPQHDDQHKSTTTSITTSFLGLEHLQPSDTFNEYTLGRSAKSDVVATKPRWEGLATSLQRNVEPPILDWTHAMVSNRHCRIFCILKPNSCTTNLSTATGSSNIHARNIHNNHNDMEVYIEDSSGNGTFINHTTLLRRGQKRMLHTGDEISLVNPSTLQKKIRSKELLQELQRHHSFIFVNVYQQQQQQQSVRPLSSLMPPPSARLATRRANGGTGLVDVRAMHSHSIPLITRRSSPVAMKSWNRPTGSASPQKQERRRNLQEPKPRRMEEEYDIRDLLGSGTCGEVRRAIHRETGQEWAVKIISLKHGRNYSRTDSTSQRTGKQQEDSTTVAKLQAEAAILQALDHPYVVQLTDVFVTPGVAIYLVMELVHGGDLFDRIVQKGKYTEVESRRVMRRLLNAVYYLHETKNIVHRDLKPENILCVTRQNDIHVKLTDFGLAKSVTDEGLKTFCGTPQYFAPEVLRRRHTVAGRGRYGKQADMWSLGIICYILLSGAPPFDVTNGMDVVADANIHFPASQWHDISADAKNLVQKLLMANPSKRISVMDACNHQWILKEDGDTHCHPLDDPIVDPNALTKRLLLYESDDDSVPLGANDELVAESTMEPEQRVQVNASSTVSIDDPTSSEAVLRISVEMEMDFEKTPSSATDKREPLSLNARGNHFRELVVNSVEKPESPTEPAQRADPEVVRLLAVAEAHRPTSNLVTPKGDEVSTEATPIGLKSSRANSSRPSQGQRKKKVVLVDAPGKAAELTDDEICSRFSDDGDSITSFSANSGQAIDQETPLDDVKKTKPCGQANKLTSYMTRIAKRTRRRDENDTSPVQREKRARVSLDDKAADPSVSSPISEENLIGREGVAASTPNSMSASLSNRTGSPRSVSSNPSIKQTGGKQTKLSSWFQKKES